MVSTCLLAVSSERVRAVVAEVLERPEYAPLSPSLWDRLVGSALEWIGRALTMVIGAQGGALVATVLLMLAAGTAAVVVCAWLWGLRRDPVRGPLVAAPIGRTADDWRAEARGHERAGRWRDALRCRYRALIAELAADGVVEEIPGRTTGEYLEAVRTARPASGQAMALATAAFETAWYGHAPVGPEAVADIEQQAARVRR